MFDDCLLTQKRIHLTRFTFCDYAFAQLQLNATIAIVDVQSCAIPTLNYSFIFEAWRTPI
jgi:hypothetical protein